MFDWHLGYLNGRDVWRELRPHGVRIIVEVEVGIELQRGRLRLVIYAAKGREIWVWRSKIASRGAGDSDARSLACRTQMMTTPVLWQRSVRKLLVPRGVEVTVGAKMRKGREWRAWILRQKRTIVSICQEGLEVAVMLVIISTLG